MALDGRSYRHAYAVDDKARRELHGARNCRATGGREAPRVQTEIVDGDDLLVGEIAWLKDARMLGEIGWRGCDDAPDLTDPHGDHRGVRQMRNSQRGIDAFIDQVHKPVEHIEVHRHRRIGVEKVIQNRMQHLLASW